MQPRLTRSATESMVAGVCGGLAEYFTIDPVIVRLLFVLVTITSGLGLPVYLLLWVIMPRAAGSPPAVGGQFGDETAQLGQQPAQERSRAAGREVLVGRGREQVQARGGLNLPPNPGDYRYDPLTGQPIEPAIPPLPQPPSLPVQATPPRGRSWSTLGLVLIGVGGLILLEQFGVDMSLVFPALLIVAGLMLMRRKS